MFADTVSQTLFVESSAGTEMVDEDLAHLPGVVEPVELFMFVLLEVLIHLCERCLVVGDDEQLVGGSELALACGHEELFLAVVGSLDHDSECVLWQSDVHEQLTLDEHVVGDGYLGGSRLDLFGQVDIEVLYTVELLLWFVSHSEPLCHAVERHTLHDE